ncbi:biotin/lipoate--protein ligase family protein [Fulvimarina sp. MAC3]|uniref:biotin/lipoate--protein ligase family protein n=1 Tax=Fulvimarina sp. MAC3 TaxID=3148887 RepID=UPI0031FDCA5F
MTATVTPQGSSGLNGSTVSIVLADPEFPPALDPRVLSADKDPFAEACDAAKTGELSAGDLLWSSSATRASAALVLEPEDALCRAIQMIPVMMVAIGDALGAIGPPNLALMFRWPGTIMANGAATGHVSFAAFPGWEADSVPDRIVVGFEILLDASECGWREPGEDLRTTALYEEGCGDLDRTMLLESIARHFLAGLDGWLHDGFQPVHQSWWSKADETRTVSLGLAGRTLEGEAVGLDEAGGLLVKTDGRTELVSLLAARTMVGR